MPWKMGTGSTLSGFFMGHLWKRGWFFELLKEFDSFNVVFVYVHWHWEQSETELVCSWDKNELFRI